MSKKTSKRYTQYCDDVNEFGNSAYEVLRGKLVDVPQYQAKQLDEAVYYLQRATDCRAKLEKEGLTTVNARNCVIPHPLVKVEKDAMNTFYKLLSGLMLTMNAIDKARHVDNTNENKALEALLS